MSPEVLFGQAASHQSLYQGVLSAIVSAISYKRSLYVVKKLGTPAVFQEHLVGFTLPHIVALLILLNR